MSGSNHPNVAIHLSHLATLYKHQGRNEEVESLLKRAIHIGEHVSGPDHPDVAIRLGNLASLYRDQGRYEEAEPLLKRALAMGEEVLGASHTEVAIRLGLLAVLYRDQGRFEEALPLAERALSICEENEGPDHPNVAASLNVLGYIYHAQDRYKEAEPLFQRSLAIFESALGPDHPSTQTVRRNYDLLLQQRDAAPLAPSLCGLCRWTSACPLPPPPLHGGNGLLPPRRALRVQRQGAVAEGLPLGVIGRCWRRRQLVAFSSGQAAAGPVPDPWRAARGWPADVTG